MIVRNEAHVVHKMLDHNRTEARTLARRQGDYSWVIDADDILSGTTEFARLNTDVHNVRKASFLHEKGDHGSLAR